MTAPGPRVFVDDDTGVRYLEDIVYERVPGGGWKVPDHERDRWDNPPVWKAAPAPEQQAKPLERLVVELEAWVDLDALLERQLRNAYDVQPVRVTRAVASVISAAEARSLRNPAGVLMRRLRDIVKGQPTP